MNAGRRVSLGDIIKIKHGFAFKGEDITTERQPHFLVTPGNFSIGGGFKLNRLKYLKGIPPEEYVLRPGDLVVTMTDLSKNMDTLGYAATVPFLPPGLTALHNQRIGLISITSPDVDHSWLEYRMRASDYRAEVLASSSGSTVHHTSPGRILQFQLDLPSLEDQQAIASTLSALDMKIESNRRASRISLKLAEAHFRRASLRAPMRRLSEHATIVLGGTPSRKRPELWQDGTVSWIASGAANADIVMEPTELITKEALDGSAAKLMPKGATVVAITGATLGQVALLGIETSGNQSLVGVWSENEDKTGWLHFALQTSVEELMKSATGAAQQHVNKGDIADLMIPIPGDEDLRAWAETCIPLVGRAIQLSEECRRLSGLRDTLLPALISGSLRAKSAEEVIT